jgi:hypothetical protein
MGRITEVGSRKWCVRERKETTLAFDYARERIVKQAVTAYDGNRFLINFLPQQHGR